MLIWMRAVRVPTLTASIIPVALGGILAYRSHSIDLVDTVLAAVAMAFLQMVSNLINDVDDFNKKVDTAQSLGSSRVLVDGLLTQKQVIYAAGFLSFSAAALGIYLTVTNGLVILILGLLGAGSAYFYTRKPFQLKYRGYGIPLVFLMFGPLPVLGSYYVSVQSFDIEPLIFSVPIGLLTTAILQANDMRDINHDKRAGIKTFAMILGSRRARFFYLLLILGAYVSVLITILFGRLSFWGIIVFLTTPLSMKLIQRTCGEKLAKTLDHETAGLQMTFGILLMASIIL